MKKSIVIYPLIVIILLFMMEQVWLTPYWLKTIVKVPLFTLGPILIMSLHGKRSFNLNLKYKSIKESIYLCIALTIVLGLTFIITFVTSFIDTSAIFADVYNRMAMPKSYLILALLYTIFVNAFFEELFFRWFIFDGYLQVGKKVIGYLFSAFCFAIYHIGIIGQWFSIPILTLVIVSLFVGGLVFAYVFEKTESIFWAYVVHVYIDIIVLGFGYLLLLSMS